MREQIQTFVINLASRTDRKDHIIRQFDHTSEFNLTLVIAVEHKIGAVGLWQTVSEIVSHAKKKKYEYIIICEDDHCFTQYYNSKKLKDAISYCNKLEADLLLGGVSYFGDAVQVNNNIFWLNGFTGTQFVIMFRRFYKKFLKMDFNCNDSIDLKINTISNNIYCLNPFISIQKEFGYSDVTKKNEAPGRVEEYFIKSQKRLETLKYLRQHFTHLGTIK